MTEQWKPIPGFEGFYEVSNLQRVRSVYRMTTTINKRTGKIMKVRRLSRMIAVDGNKVHLTRGPGTRTSRNIIALVAEVFG